MSDTDRRESAILELGGPSSARTDAQAFLAAFDLSGVPAAPGCYLMQEASGQVIYVGKAKNLRARVRSYVNAQDTRYSVRFLMRRVARIRFLVTHNDKEALLLENSLIKEHRPRYNVQLKDDKNFLSLRIDPRERFPRITTVRRSRKDGARYFGPYTSSDAMRKMLRQMQRLFPLRTCSDHVLNNRTRPCLYYQLKRCVAPCVGYVDEARYQEIVEQAILSLEGRNTDLAAKLRARIQELADALEFEQAAALRDRLYAIRQSLERQRAVGAPGAPDRDVIGLHREGRFTELQIIFYRNGKLLGGRSFSFERTEMPHEELLSSFLLQYYADAPVIPGEILVPIELDETEALEELLAEHRGGTVRLRHPQRGEKRGLVALACENARHNFAQKRLREKSRDDALEEVRRALGLPRTPQRIECFDISTTQGSRTVGSMAVFTGGTPDKARYRRYAIRTIEGQDDFAAMREVLLRRYTRAIEEDDLPDLVLIDGGKGQLNVAAAALRDLAIEDLPVASIAKSRATASGRTDERFFVPGRMNPIVPRQNSAAVLLLARIRDEAHRFAVTYHRKRRKAAALSTRLTEIPGVGPKRARALLNALGSVARIRAAGLEEIAAVPGFSPALAERVHAHLNPGPESP